MDIYDEMLAAISAGHVVACAPGVRDGDEVLCVHASVVSLDQLPYVGHPLMRVRAGFALGHIRKVRRDFAAEGVEFAGSVG